MNRVRFWTRSKSFLSKTGPARKPVLFSIVILLTICFFGCVEPQTNFKREPLPESTAKPRSRTESPIPPWQIWDIYDISEPEFRAADELENSGQFEQSLRAYREIESRPVSPRVKEEAFVRGIGTLLKLGRSKAALEQITQHLKLQNLKTQDISTVLALLAAYSYLHQSDIDQTLAWLGVAYRKADTRGVVARRAKTEMENLIRAIPPENFSKEYEVWSADPFYLSMFDREKKRRAQGGQNIPIQSLQTWFRPDSYGAQPPSGLVPDETLTASLNTAPSNAPVIGVLLPVTGKYAEPSKHVRDGIELALQDMQLADKVKLVFADTAGDPLQAENGFEQLVTREGAAMILGPLLVKTSEQVAKKSDAAGVAYLTFTKRPGITTLSHNGFRLGATAANQASELASYAATQLNAKNVAIFFPDDGGGGEEFSSAFRGAAAKYRLKVVAQASYLPGNPQSIEAAVSSAAGKTVDAVFIPDTLENSVSVIRAVRASEMKNAVLLGPALWNDPVAVRGFGALIEGAVYVTPFYSASAKPNVVRFVNQYRQAYGGDPDLLAAQAYDAATLVFKAFQNAQSESGELKSTLIKKLRAVDSYEGVTGKLSVTANGEIERRMSVLRVYRGGLIEVMSAGTVTGFVPDEPQQEKAPT